MKKLLFFLGFAMTYVACGGGASTAALPELSLLEHGMPIKIKAPEGAEVDGEDMGIMQDVTVMGEGNFSLQITSGNLRSTDIAKKKAEALEEVKNGPFFEEIVEEHDAGFIFKKKITEEKVNYDFRHIKIQGSKEYLFQTGMMGQFTLDEVKRMYASVQ